MYFLPLFTCEMKPTTNDKLTIYDTEVYKTREVLADLLFIYRYIVCITAQILFV